MFMMRELVSIIIRTKDRPEFLKEALRSVYCQSYPDIETIVVNDGGVTLKDKISAWSQVPPYKLIEFEANRGRSIACNEGINNASGKYIGFLDDDDILYPNHVEMLISAISDEHPIVYSDALKAVQIKNNGSYKTFDFFLEYSVEHSLKRILEGNFIPIQCLLFKAELLHENLVDTSLSVLEDWDLLIRLSSKYQFKHIKKITSEYRFRLDKSNTTGNNLEIWQNARKYINDKYQELVRGSGLKSIPIK